MTTIKDRVTKGRELLDEQMPNWCDSVDLEELNLDSPWKCVLGQVYGKPREDNQPQWGGNNSGFNKGRKILFKFLRNDYDDMSRFTFDHGF